MLLEVRDLTTRIGKGDQAVVPVHQLSFSIAAGETFALLGESGCGKSMTALSIMRLLPHNTTITHGDILLDGKNLPDLTESQMRKERGGRIGMIFQEPMTSLNPVISIGKQIAEAIHLHDSQPKKITKAKVIELLKAVGISDPQRRYYEYPHQLSGGMKQRAMIAMALAGKPELLIADEPTTALDVTIQAQVLALIKDLQAQSQMGIMLITHDLGIVAETADRIAVMYAGEIIEIAKVSDFFIQPKHPYSQRLFDALPNALKRERELQAIDGMVPLLHQVFKGCRFAPRCTLAEDKCFNEIPKWRGTQVEGYQCHFELRNALEQQAPAPHNASDKNQALLQVSNLKVYFPIRKGVLRRTIGYVKAVDGIDLNINKGQTMALVGESGCGKTTVGKGILQLIKPREGSVVLNGIELTTLNSQQMRAQRANCQIIFQDPALSMNPRMTVEEVIAEGLVTQHPEINREERLELIEAMLHQVGMPVSALNRYPHEFSGGQRQRIALARALILHPDLIVCDEPTSALDVSVQAQILNLLKSLHQKQQIAYLFITHNIAVVSYLADEVSVMYLGRIVEQGDVETVMNNPLHPYTQALLSAVPVIDLKTKKEVIRLQGDIPSPVKPPSGCHFNPRCPQAMEICSKTYPEMTNTSDGRKVCCHLLN